MILEGYCQTESCGPVSFSRSSDSIGGSVGGPIESCELKLVDVPALKYFSTDKDEKGQYLPRGEICTRGPTIFRGYFNDPENTHKSIDKDGWLHSGDVGAILPGNSVRIIDRIKDIFKLIQGEFVSPEKLEIHLIKSKYINQICITGEATEDHIVAIIVPKISEIMEFLNSVNIFANDDNLSVLLTSPELINEILKDLENIGRANAAKGFEVVKNIHLTLEEFSEENGLLTPTKNLKRKEIKKKYQNEINNIYYTK